MTVVSLLDQGPASAIAQPQHLTLQSISTKVQSRVLSQFWIFWSKSQYLPDHHDFYTDQRQCRAKLGTNLEMAACQKVFT